MELSELIKKYKRTNKKIEKLRNKYERLYKSEKFKLDEELETIITQIRLKTNKNKFVYISK